ncbi:MAG: NUDIX domain-containing protein [Candidatus Nomurabacteria bacterium]|jgi:isopentenyldiphosphate isomerase|nr:NUDIX domain-containing protein [Candidatus Nomurabacteria bacterium]
MNLIYVVDKDDNVIGEVDDNRPDAIDGLICRVSGCWVINPTNKEVLIAQRSLKKWHSPGEWSPSVVGTVEVGETYEQNIRKEVAEEIGLVNVEFLPIGKWLHSGGHDYFYQMFLTECDWPVERFTLQDEEVAQVKWVNIDELAKDLNANPNKYVSSFSESLLCLKNALETELSLVTNERRQE